MKVRLRQLASDLAESFWLLPSAMVLASVVLAMLLPAVDRQNLLPAWLTKSDWLLNAGSRGHRPARCAVAPPPLGRARPRPLSAPASPTPPTRVTLRVSSTRRSFACTARDSSPSSSRKTVPPWADSKMPAFAASAPENAPREWPKSSLSASPSGSAAQLRFLRGPAWRRLRRPGSPGPRRCSELPR